MANSRKTQKGDRQFIQAIINYNSQLLTIYLNVTQVKHVENWKTT
jgi:hypothetical protein